MKPLFLVLIATTQSIITCGATHYINANGGSDANSGNTINAPWLTLKNINDPSQIADGDSIGIAAGSVIYGSIIIHHKRLTFFKYNAGKNPVITGLSKVKNWVSLGNNIWESSSPVSALSSCNLLIINGVNTPMGRTPNAGTFYHYQSHTGVPAYNGNSTFSITSSGLSGKPDWTGAELAAFVTTYGLNRVTIKSHRGKTLYWTDPTNLQERFEAGVSEFFIQNDPRTLDQANEWYYNPLTHKIRIYNSARPKNVELASQDTLVNIGYDSGSRQSGNGYDYTGFYHIAFRGSNKMIVLLRDSKHASFINCSFSFAGTDAINNPYWGKASYASVKNCTFYNINNTAIGLVEAADHATITGNTFNNTGAQIGMGAPVGDYSYTGLYTSIHALGTGTLIQNNVINNTGYTGITMRGDSSRAINNVIDTALTILHDGGGIYTWNNAAHGPHQIRGMKIQANIVLHVANDVGIYCDDGANGIEVSGNAVAYCKSGIYTHNNWNMYFHDNVTYDCFYTGFNYYHDIDSIWMHNLVIANNVFFAATANEYAAFFFPGDSIRSSTTRPGMNNNYYLHAAGDKLIIGVQNKPTFSVVKKTIEQWVAYSGRESASRYALPANTPGNSVVIQINNTGTSQTYALPRNYTPVNAAIENGSILLAPFSCAALIYNGAAVNHEHSLSIKKGNVRIK